MVLRAPFRVFLAVHGCRKKNGDLRDTTVLFFLGDSVVIGERGNPTHGKLVTDTPKEPTAIFFSICEDYELLSMIPKKKSYNSI